MAQSFDMVSLAQKSGLTDALRQAQQFRFGPWDISYDPPPIQSRDCDWHYTHDDDDGAPDGYSGRSGHAASLDNCLNEIAELIDDMAHDCTCSAPTLADCMAVACPLRFKLIAA